MKYSSINNGVPLLMGLDLGTSAIKGIIMSASGDIVAQEKKATKLLRSKDGNRVEFCAEEQYRIICELIRSMLKNVPDKRSVKAICMAAASGNALLLDKEMKPLTKVASWLDRRAIEDDIDLKIDPQKVYGSAGWPLNSKWFPLAQFAWQKQKNADVYSQAKRFCMDTDYLLFRLCGKWGMDYSTATTFFLQDQKKLEWNKDLIAELGMPETSLSQLMSSGTVLGSISKKASEQTSLSEDAKVITGSFDHPSAARGAGVLASGDLLLSCGTSWVGFYPIENREKALSQNMLIDPFLSPGGGPWGGMFSLACIGENINEMLKQLIDAPESERHKTFDALAAKAPPGANGLRINPLKDKRLELMGACKEDACRAIMEGAAFCMREKIEELSSAGIKANNITMAGGPSQSPVWPQILADITGLELKLFNGQNAGAAGAAILAGIGTGIFKNETEAFTNIKREIKVVLPDKGTCEKYDYLFEASKNV